MLTNNECGPTTIKQNEDISSFCHRANVEYSIYDKFFEEYLRNLH